MIYYNYKHQPIGEMRGGIFLKKVNPKKHFMKIYQGYGISTSVYNQLVADGCTEIRVDDGTDLYRITMEDFARFKISANYDDPQVFCPLKKFQRKDDKQKTLL